MLRVDELSCKYKVRMLQEADVENIFALCLENPQYYQYCPPFVTMDSIRADMVALPPRTTKENKFYVGFYNGERLVAVLDLILGFPNEATAFIGFFMMNAGFQGKGIGTEIVTEVFSYLKNAGFQYVRLGFAKGNPQSEHFWLKNGFARTGVEAENEGYTVVVLQKEL